MIKSMPGYVCAMSDGDIDILEEIFIKKYSEFLDCYWILKDFSDYIDNLTYDKKKEDCLSIKFSLSSVSPDDVIHTLKSQKPKCGNLKIIKSKNKITLNIYKIE